MELILDGNKLLATTSTKELFDELIQIESFGSIYLQANAHSQDLKERESLEIDFRNLVKTKSEMILSQRKNAKILKDF